MRQVVVNKFLGSIKSKHTAKIYEQQWERYMKEKPDSIDSTNVGDIELDVIRYITLMKNDGFSYSYRNIALSAIVKHYKKIEGIKLNREDISEHLGERIFDNDIRGYTKDEIKRMLEVADIKYRAIILTLASTGMRREALTQLIIEDDLEEVQTRFGKLYKLTIYRHTNEQQVCFTTPEAANAIDLWLKTKNDGHKELFYFASPRGVSNNLREIAIRAGVVSPRKAISSESKAGQNRAEIPAAHGFKKFTITQMDVAGIPEEKAKRLTGHSIGVRKHYLDNDLLQDYLTAVDNLTINDENRLQSENIELKKKNDEIEILKQQVQELQEANYRAKESAAFVPLETIEKIRKSRGEKITKEEEQRFKEIEERSKKYLEYLFNQK